MGTFKVFVNHENKRNQLYDIKFDTYMSLVMKATMSYVQGSGILKYSMSSITKANLIDSIITGHPFNYNVCDVIKKNFHFLKNDP